MLRAYPVSTRRGHILETLVAEVAEQEPSLVESSLRIVVHVPIDDEQIRPRVVVVVQERDPPAKEPGDRAESGGSRHLCETSIAIVPVYVRRVIDEVGFREI